MGIRDELSPDGSSGRVGTCVGVGTGICEVDTSVSLGIGRALLGVGGTSETITVLLVSNSEV